MTKISTIVILALALFANRCAHYPMNGPLTILFLVTVFTFGLGFDWHDQSAEEIRHRNNSKATKRQ